MNGRVRLVLCLLMVLGWPGVVMGASGAGGTKGGKTYAAGLPVVTLTPQVKTLPPVIDEDSWQKATAFALEGQLLQASWILDDPGMSGGRVVQIIAKEMADTGSRLVISATGNWHAGDRLTIHRPGVELHDAEKGQSLGWLSETVGMAEVVAFDDQKVTATVVKVFKEMMVGDLVDAFYNEKILPRFREDPDFGASGSVIAMDRDLEMAATGQVVVVGLGMKDRAYPGLVLPVYQHVSQKIDSWSMFSSPEPPRLDPLPIADVVFFRVAAKASLALVIRAIEPVEKGDRIGRPNCIFSGNENP
ncbi:MAG: hypothetical protein HQL73_04610 [Magnetococcales bacterium]|nr:hypothetical protein [Magnetococcales bacterium]